MSKKLARINNEFGLYEYKGQPMCSSRQIAETFGKRHDHVLRDIQNLGCSKGFSERNFIETHYLCRGKKYPMVLMSLSGLTLLCFYWSGPFVSNAQEYISTNVGGGITIGGILQSAGGPGKRGRLGYIYFVQSKPLGYIKIGHTRHLRQRINQLQAFTPDPLVLLGTIKTPTPSRLECELHYLFRDCQFHDEWFYPTDDLLGYIVENAEVPSYVEPL